MSKQTKVLVTGAGGFIGHHLTRYLTDRGYYVRGVDIKAPEYESTAADEFLRLHAGAREKQGIGHFPKQKTGGKGRHGKESRSF